MTSQYLVAICLYFNITFSDIPYYNVFFIGIKVFKI
jgi:hypothetical protein